MKDFKELFDLDVSKYIKKKPIQKKGQNGQMTNAPESEWLDYIEWAQILILLYENGAEKVLFGIIPNADGHPVYTNKNNEAPFIRVYVEVDDDRREIYFPVPKNWQNDISFAEKRAFVKCVAINWGLGLKLWLDNEQKNIENPETIDQEKNNALTVQLLKLFQSAIGLLGDANKVHEKLKTDKKAMDILFKSPDLDKKQYYIKLLTDLIVEAKKSK